MSDIYVTKRDDRKELLDITKIKKYTEEVTADFEDISAAELEIEAQMYFYDGIATSEIQKALIKAAESKIDIDKPNWSFIAARLLMIDIKNTFLNTLKKYGYTSDNLLKSTIELNNELGLSTTRGFLDIYNKDNLIELNNYIDYDRDKQFTYIGLDTMLKRYLNKSENEIYEVPQIMFMLTSMKLASIEKEPVKWAKRFYDIMSKFEVMAATPTLNNSRSSRSQLSSCYVGSTPDNIEGIFDTYREAALLSKYGGGIGWDWSKVRASLSSIDKHKGVAGGLIPFLKIADSEMIAVDQLGCVAENSYVKILESVTTEKYTHNFIKRLKKYNLDKNEVIDLLKDEIKKYTFEYSDLSKDDIYKLLSIYISERAGNRVEKITKMFNISRDKYKRIIGKFKKINKKVPNGFKKLNQNSNYIINKKGIIVKLNKLNILSAYSLNKKGYVVIKIGKKGYSLHRLIYEHFGKDFQSNLSIDHIDGNKVNNNINNLDNIYIKENVKRYIDNNIRDDVSEKVRIIRHLSKGHRLKGHKRNTKDFNIKEIKTKTIKITDVRVGDLIMSYDIKDMELRFCPVVKTYDLVVEKKNQIKLKFEDGNYIITSLWHPFPVMKNGKLKYIRSDEVKVEDYTVNEFNQLVRVSEISSPNISEKYADLTVKYTNNYFCSTDNKDGNFHLIHNTRPGAMAVYIEPWHLDIYSFLDLKKASGEPRRRTYDLNPALWINDLFMKRVTEDSHWTLFDPYDVSDLTDTYGEEFEKRYLEYEKREDIRKEKVSAKDLWKKILRSYFETGSPFLGFKDTANNKSMKSDDEIIRSSNLCTEIFQPTEPNKYEADILYEKNGKLETISIPDNEKVYTTDGELITTKDINQTTPIVYNGEIIDGIYSLVRKPIIGTGRVAVCNLASVNLSKINTKEDFERVIPIAIRMLDNVIDINYYPAHQTSTNNKLTRAIGLGLMGEHHLMALKGIHFTSKEHKEYLNEIMEYFSYNVIKASAELAEEKGSFKLFNKSKWSNFDYKEYLKLDTKEDEDTLDIPKLNLRYDWEELGRKVRRGMRNGYLMAIAPTSTISLIVGTSQTIEPIYKKVWDEVNKKGKIRVVAPDMNLDTINYYKSAYEYNQVEIVKTAAVRQRYIDQGQSINIHMKLDKVSGKYLNAIYSTAWLYGCKSTYYLRSMSPEALYKTDEIDRSVECAGCQ